MAGAHSCGPALTAGRVVPPDGHVVPPDGHAVPLDSRAAPYLPTAALYPPTAPSYLPTAVSYLPTAKSYLPTAVQERALPWGNHHNCECGWRAKTARPARMTSPQARVRESPTRKTRWPTPAGSRRYMSRLGTPSGQLLSVHMGSGGQPRRLSHSSASSVTSQRKSPIVSCPLQSCEDPPVPYLGTGLTGNRTHPSWLCP